jgi:hypothetical protein
MLVRGGQVLANRLSPFIHLGLVALKWGFLFANLANDSGVTSIALDVAFAVTETALELQFWQAKG